MNPILSAISRCFRRSQCNCGRTSRPKAWRTRLCLETLEDRSVPAAKISVANASMNEIDDVSPFIDGNR